MSAFSSPENAQVIVRAAEAEDNGTDAVIATDTAGTIVYWSPRAAALYGWDAEAVLGCNVVDVTPTHASTDDAERVMESAAAGEEFQGEFIVRHRDGTPILAHVEHRLVRRGDAVIGVVGVSRPSARMTPPGSSSGTTSGGA